MLGVCVVCTLHPSSLPLLLSKHTMPGHSDLQSVVFEEAISWVDRGALWELSGRGDMNKAIVPPRFVFANHTRWHCSVVIQAPPELCLTIRQCLGTYVSCDGIVCTRVSICLGGCSTTCRSIAIVEPRKSQLKENHQCLLGLRDVDIATDFNQCAWDHHVKAHNDNLANRASN